MNQLTLHRACQRYLVVNVFFVAVLSMPHAFASSGQVSSWGYDGLTGPTHWSELANAYHLCDTGRLQSPINIDNAVVSKLFTLAFDYRPVPLQISNNGHTIQFNYTTLRQNKVSYITIGGEQHSLPEVKQYHSVLTISGEKYQLRQVHFHSPSEHAVDGENSVLEAHFMHVNDQQQLAVIGALFRVGEANPMIDKLWQYMSSSVSESHHMDVAINAADLLPANKEAYHYRGSLTTPPCSEGVRWFVFREKQTVSKSQVSKFLSVIGENARPVQPLNDRYLLKAR